MHIGMVVSHFQQEYGGHEYYLCKELSKLGHQVTLYTSDRTRPGYDTKKFIKISDNESFEIKRFHANFEISEIPIMTGLSKALRQDELDIIHSHEFFQVCSLIACRVAKREHIPFILTQHAMGSLPLNKLRKIPYVIHKKTIGKYLFKHSDRIITLSSKARDALIAFGVEKNKVRLIPTGVPTEAFKPSVSSFFEDRKIHPNGKKVLFVGRLVENKGVVALLQAFHLVLDEINDVTLFVVGKGPLEAYLKSLVVTLGIAEKVVFLGKIDQKMMPAVYSDVDIFVLPTLYKEPFGIAAVEALSSGLPVIASNLEGLTDIITDGEVGFLIEPGNVKMLQKYMIDLLKNDSMRNKFSINARSRAINEFDWEKVAHRTISLYKEMQEEVSE